MLEFREAGIVLVIRSFASTGMQKFSSIDRKFVSSYFGLRLTSSSVHELTTVFTGCYLNAWFLVVVDRPVWNLAALNLCL